MTNSISAAHQANFIYITRFCEKIEEALGRNIVVGEKLRQEMILIKGNLSIHEEDGRIGQYIGSGFSFNIIGKIDESLPVFQKSEFCYNRTAQVVEEMLSKDGGEEIFDKRFGGFYRFTKRKLKRKYQAKFENWVEKNRSISNEELKALAALATDKIKTESYVFHEKHNGKESANKSNERYGFLAEYLAKNLNQ